MELTGYYIRIAKLIALEITNELSDSEREELNNWLSTSQENKRLYKRIRLEITDLIENDKKSGVQHKIAWNKIAQETILQKMPFPTAVFLKYAAVFLFVIATSVVLYSGFTKKSEPQLAVDYSIDTELQPGVQKALLVTSNGLNIELNQEKNDSILVEDGAIIKNNLNVLTYEGLNDSEKSKKKKEKVVYNTLITPKGGEYNLVLSDGTKVWLNANSKLKYPVKFIGQSREIELEGEAYFEVDKNPHKPFIIKTNDYSVNVLGTSFNISAYDDDDRIITTLVEGIVNIKDFDGSGNGVQIKPDEQFILNKVEKGVLIRNVDVGDYIGWKEGRFIFIKQDLKSILGILSRWYNFDFQFENEGLKDLIFTGNMDRYDQLNTTLEMIAKTNKVDFRIEDNTVLVTTKK